MSTILVLADRKDFLATRVAAALRNARQPVRVLTPLELSLGSAWTCKADGKIERELRPKRSGRPTPRAVLNRLHAAQFFPENVWSTAGDTVYAEGDFAHMITSWLASLPCLVLGPPSGVLPCQNLSVIEWLTAARDAWLPTRAVTLAGATPAAATHAGTATAVEERVTSPVVVAEPVTAIRPVYVVAGRVIGAPDSSIVPGVQRLAERSGCNLLECHFGWTGTTPGRWVFCDATAVPMNAPAALLDAIVAALTGR